MCIRDRTSNEFFDYDAKYNGQVQEITPARLSPETAEEVAKTTSRIYDCLLYTSRCV